ncbi:hypothetical protein L228DRAFT_250469 [Xylona heveae TC161]|uniref:Uncharacterized protein n=1 Tax=Xylona heveae (strain CBS 132557 / TC161) TaxID=1328760 RepID=A0A165A6Y4_XYLHT|nr:hypothetical protein L228DRAFT_250469 [Xylona heveae TC161]KZF20041.1 hypothetical protein L228DRAFT_250469 [Xylona heveae TC161]
MTRQSVDRVHHRPTMPQIRLLWHSSSCQTTQSSASGDSNTRQRSSQRGISGVFGVGRHVPIYTHKELDGLPERFRVKGSVFVA